MSVPELLGGLEIRVNGRLLDPTVTDRLIDARVQDNLMLPDTFQLRLRDPHFELVDGTTFDIGAKVELRYAPPSSTAPVQPVVSGEVATIAPEFEHDGCVLVARGCAPGAPRLPPPPQPHPPPPLAHVPGHDRERHRDQGRRRGRAHRRG